MACSMSFPMVAVRHQELRDAPETTTKSGRRPGISDRPATPVLPADERVGLGAAAGPHGFRVPLDLLAGLHGEAAHQHRLGHGRAEVDEVAERGRAALAGAEPLLDRKSVV